MDSTKYTQSKKLFSEDQQYIPGGVNSPVRAFKSVGGTPIYIDHAKGAYLFDEDGNRYIDYVNSWGALMFGHAFSPVIESVQSIAMRGTSYGIPTRLETEIARLTVSMVPNIDKIRMVNSGTEACMSAIRLARGFTGKNKIIKFVGCYHGHADPFLIAGGSGLSTFGIASSAGVPPGAVSDTLLALYNSLRSVEMLFERYPGKIGAIIIEPVAGNMGCVAPQTDFLKGLRKLCNEHNALLIFDEVMTGFRLAKGGAQEYFGVNADIVTFGKIIGGGMPVGAFEAHAEIMDCLAPNGNVYQAGTLSGNPLAMSAGIQMLNALNADDQLYSRLEEKTDYLARKIAEVFAKTPIAFTINKVGSMISLFFDGDEIVDFQSALKADNRTFKKFFHGMLMEGIYLPPSPYESWFLSDALTYDDLDYTVKAIQRVAKILAKTPKKTTPICQG